MSDVKMSEAERMLDVAIEGMAKVNAMLDENSARLMKAAAAELRRLAAEVADWKRLTDDLKLAVESDALLLSAARQEADELRADRDRLAAEVEALRADAALGRFVRTRVTECHNGWAIAQTFIHGAPSLEDVADAVPAIDAARASAA